MKIPSWEELKGECLKLIIDKRRRYLLIAGAVLLLFWSCLLAVSLF